MDKPLPDFQISDAEGKTWRLADLKGKVTLVNLWATWCGPCRNELPYLQKLFNKVRERKDLVVITLNTDDNPGLILPFLAENKYTFPCWASAWLKLIRNCTPDWIVNADGVPEMERTGFGGSEDKWIDETIGLMKARHRSLLLRPSSLIGLYTSCAEWDARPRPERDRRAKSGELIHGG
jgi:thiol-disulfide isomerase/thioredoxin